MLIKSFKSLYKHFFSRRVPTEQEWKEMLEASIRDYVKRYSRGSVSLSFGKYFDEGKLGLLKEGLLAYDFTKSR